MFDILITVALKDHNKLPFVMESIYKHIKGYRDLFVENEEVREFEFGDIKLKVHLRLATEDMAVFGDKDFYKKYWIEPNEFDIKLYE